MNTTHLTRSRARRVLLALCAALPLWATAQAPEPVKLGVIGPFSGPSSDFGTPMLQGIKLAVDEINAVGGYLGRPLELVVRDDQGTPDVGLKASQELVAAGVLGTVGFCNTGVALKSLDVYQDHKHLLMVPVSTGSAVTAKYPAADSFVFRVSPNDTLQAAFVVNEVVDKRGLTRVAVFADKTGYGEGGLQDVVKFLAERKLKPVYVGRFDLGVKSLVDEVHAAKAAGAEAIIGYTVGPEQAVLVKARAETQFAGPLFGPWPMSFRTV